MLAKKLLTFVLAATIGLQPFAASATNLGDAFSAITGSGSAVATNAPGRFSSAARGGFTAGGFDVRVPRSANAPQLLSVTPPNVTAGCNGISAHFGGFSFISGREFGELLKQIASGAALGFVSSLVMKTLCPACEAVVQELKSAAQAASRLAKDSCDIGKDFAKDFKNGIGIESDKVSVCAERTADAGVASDTLSAYQDTCKGLWAASEALKGFTSKVNGKDSPTTNEEERLADSALDKEVPRGNVTWNGLVQLDSQGMNDGASHPANSRKLMLINMMGAEMAYKDASTQVGCDVSPGVSWIADANKEGGATTYCGPKANTKLLSALFMCGGAALNSSTASNLDVSNRIKTYCNKLVGVPTSPAELEPHLWTCKDSASGSDNYASCNYLKLVPASQVVTGKGLLIEVNQLLREAVRRVRAGQSFTEAGDTASSSGITGKQIVNLVNAAPYPLYQAINAAAVYPAAAEELIDSMSILVAEQYAYAVLDEVLTAEGRTNGVGSISRAQATQLLDFIGSLRSQGQANLGLIAQNFTVQQALTEQIRMVNIAIQRQVLSQDLLSTGKMAESLNRAVTGTGAGSVNATAGAPVTGE